MTVKYGFEIAEFYLKVEKIMSDISIIHPEKIYSYIVLCSVKTCQSSA